MGELSSDAPCAMVGRCVVDGERGCIRTAIARRSHLQQSMERFALVRPASLYRRILTRAT
jgi:hypothetical protein